MAAEEPKACKAAEHAPQSEGTEGTAGAKKSPTALHMADDAAETDSGQGCSVAASPGRRVEEDTTQASLLVMFTL